MKNYKAPWGTQLIVTSSLVTVVCAGTAGVLIASGNSTLPWVASLPLAGLRSVQFQPDAMRGGIHAFGNGGLFSFAGFFSSRALGGYRAYVTDVHRTVVLRFASSTVVVSPSAPEEFVRDVDVASRAGQPRARTDGGAPSGLQWAQLGSHR